MANGMIPGTHCSNHGEMERRLREKGERLIRMEERSQVMGEDLKELKTMFAGLTKQVEELKVWQVKVMAVFSALVFLSLHWEKVKAFFGG